MSDKSLRFVVSAVDRSMGKTLGDVVTKSETTTKRISSTFGRLGGVIGGEVGELLNRTSEGLDKLGESGGSHLSEKLAVGGAAVAGIGAALTMMGAAEKQATDQLANAIGKTGHSIDEFEAPIEKSVGQMENFGYAATSTKTALMKLTNATHDPTRALGLMGETADLAASKHISLESAADQVAKIIAGKGSRTMSAYNIALVKNADGTTNWIKTNEALARQLNGAAAAAANNFGGEIKALTTKIEDNVAEFGQKWGPAITAAGAGMLVLAPVVKGLGSGLSWVKGKFGEAGAAATASAGEIGASVTAEEAYSLRVQAWSAEEAAAVAKAKAVEAQAAADAAAAIEAATVGTDSVLAEGAAATSASAAEFAIAQQAEADAAEAAAVRIAAAAAAATVAEEEEGAASMGMLGPIGLAAGVVGGLALAFMGESNASALASGSTDGFTESVKKSTDAVNAANVAAVNKVLSDNKSLDMLDSLHGKNLALGVSYGDLARGVTGSDKQFQHLTGSIGHSTFAQRFLNEQLTEARTKLFGAIEEQKKYNKSSGELATKADAAAQAAQRQADKFGTTTDALTAAKAAADKSKASNDANTLAMQLESDAAGLLSASFDKLNGKTLDVKQADLAAKDAVAQLNDAQKQNGHTLDANTAKGRANTEAILSAIQAAQTHAEAVGKETGSTEKASAAYQKDIGWLKQHASNLGYNTSKVNDLVKEYGRLPAVKRTQVDITGDAYDRLYGIRDQLEKTTGHVWTVVVNEQGNVTSGKMQGGAGFNAAGTDYFAGGMTHLNEREPEIVDLPRGSRITPVSRMSSSGGAGAPTIVHLTVNVTAVGPVAPSREMGREIGKHLEQYLGTGGRVRGVNG